MYNRAHRLASLIATLTCVAPAASVRAQATGVAVRATNTSITVDEGAVVTAVFTLRNDSRDSASITSSLTLPTGWTNVTGLAPRSLAAGASDTWIAGVTVPANARAGRYVIRGVIVADGVTTSDSVAVVIGERRAVEVMPLELPAWTPASGAYEATFIVRNRGNVHSTVGLKGTTSRGSRAIASPASVTLAPGASARIAVRVSMALDTRKTTDDVIELEARVADGDVAPVIASARTTVVPKGRAGRAYETIPSTIAVRSANGAAGISPVMLRGTGRINGTHTDVDFLFQAPTNQDGPVSFGERDEYRLSVKSDHIGARLGDHVFGWSPLTSSGTMGTGAEVRGSRGLVEGGAYAQRPRWSEGTRGEQGAFLGLAFDSTARVAGTVMSRQATDGTTVHVAGAGSQARIFGTAFEVEGAASDSNLARGYAVRAGLSRTNDRLSYEAGFAKGSAGFAGPFGGWMSEGASVAAQVTRRLSVTGSGRINEWGGRDSTTIAAGQRLSTVTASVSWGGALTAEYSRLGRKSLTIADDAGAGQQGIRLTATHNIGILSMSAGAERGAVRDNSSRVERPYTQGSLSLTTSAGKYGSLGVSVAYNHGNTITGLTDGVSDVGVNSTLRLPFGFEFGLAGSARRASLGVLDSSGAWFSVMDARLDKRVGSGSVIGVHARTMQSPYTINAPTTHTQAVYLEYRRDLRLPFKPSRERGRAIGRVLNADDKSPLAGALVRLGSEAAVTDRDGIVRFAGLEPGQYRVSIEATGAAAGAMLSGDVVVDLREPSDRPREFTVAVARGGRVSASVRMFSRRGTIGAAAGELADAGGAPNVVVILAGMRDTLYQTSDENGRVDFGSVAPGAYTLAVRGTDAPEQTKFETERREIIVLSGEKVVAEFKLVPRERTIKMIDAGAVKASR